ncbi:GDSL esterase/lipase At1g29660-like [Vicia villosa]|uniref:GDSL esterase/lipase At1g29660-like n=1 Tax=Vicia villosa TaxID=3911 RepID=UPI00273AC1CF|nr:GDSL esterase/lipase At1g29660-like [Vicia villosa]
MASETKTWLILHLLFLIACYMQHCVNGESSQVPCLFIFGDSFSDSGNNNYIPTIAKANYTPYGIDYPDGPTGRVTNGETQVDIIGNLLGFEKPIPPFENINGSDIRKGVNYASSSAGIRNETGKRTMRTNIDLGQQIENHKIIVAQISKFIGVISPLDYLKKCLYFVYIGTNDYALNYFQPQFYPTSSTYRPEQYAQVLSNQLSDYVEDLYDLGARKFVAVGLGKIGCTPMALNNTITDFKRSKCVERLNDIEAMYSHRLRSLVNQFNTKHQDSKAIFVNTTAIGLDSSLESSVLGITNFNQSCCPTMSDGFCVRDSTPCANRDEYIYYDGIHPTSAVNNITASLAYDSTDHPEITSPMDIKHLAQLVI